MAFKTGANMSQGLDVDSFLKNGYWQNTRARSPEPNV